MTTIREMLTPEDQVWAEEVLKKFIAKMPEVTQRNFGKMPYTTGADGRYDDRSDMSRFSNYADGKSWWTNGFWGGLLWQMYVVTKDEQYLTAARRLEEDMDDCFHEYYGLHHDVGFMWMPTAVADYKITGNKESLKRGLLAANLLAGRFNPVGKFIRAWNSYWGDSNEGWAIIDCMMNISMLHFAGKQIGDPRYQEIAMLHADTVIQNFIRENGSSVHICEFDAKTGKKVGERGGQGYKEGSAWTRGQAWALYGFYISYANTGEQRYLDTSCKVADYFASCMENRDYVPIDFDQPAEPAYEDSCGAVIAACGFLELAKVMEEQGGKEKARLYLSTGLKILKNIEKNRTIWDQSCDAVVQNCSASYHDKDHHFTMVYADYYFLEAICKLNDTGFFTWGV